MSNKFMRLFLLTENKREVVSDHDKALDSQCWGWKKGRSPINTNRPDQADDLKLTYSLYT